MGGIEQQRDSWIEGYVAAVLGKIGEQQKRACIEIGNDQDKRRERRPMQARGERSTVPTADQPPAERARAIVWRCFAHRLSEPGRRGCVKAPQRAGSNTLGAGLRQSDGTRLWGLPRAGNIAGIRGPPPV